MNTAIFLIHIIIVPFHWDCDQKRFAAAYWKGLLNENNRIIIVINNIIKNNIINNSEQNYLNSIMHGGE